MLLIGNGDGPMTSYFENGNLKAKGSYKKSSKHGEWVVYRSDGTTNEELSGNYDKGCKLNQFNRCVD